MRSEADIHGLPRSDRVVRSGEYPRLAALALAALIVGATAARADVLNFQADLTGGREVPLQ